MKNIAKDYEDYEEEYDYSSSKKQKMSSNKKVKKMKNDKL